MTSMAKRKKASAHMSARAVPTGTSSVRWDNKGKNTPTKHLRGFVQDDDGRQVVLDPRNPNLEPQLV